MKARSFSSVSARDGLPGFAVHAQHLLDAAVRALHVADEPRLHRGRPVGGRQDAVAARVQLLQFRHEQFAFLVLRADDAADGDLRAEMRQVRDHVPRAAGTAFLGHRLPGWESALRRRCAASRPRRSGRASGRRRPARADSRPSQPAAPGDPTSRFPFLQDLRRRRAPAAVHPEPLIRELPDVALEPAVDLDRGVAARRPRGRPSAGRTSARRRRPRTDTAPAAGARSR